MYIWEDDTAFAYTPYPSSPPPSHTQSKFAPEELEVRGQMVTQMQTEIQELKEVSLAGYIRKGNFNGNAMAGMLVPMEESEAFKGPMGTLMCFLLIFIVSVLDCVL